MKKFKLTKNDIIKFAVIFVLSLLVIFLNRKGLGKKDFVMLFASTMIILYALEFIFEDSKKSILIFIVGFPLLVTARKFVYFDFLVFKITYETMYVTILFIFNINNIIKFIKDIYKSGNKSDFKFIALSIIFLIFAINSAIFSDNIATSLSYTYISVMIPIMFILCVGSIFDKKNVDKIIWALIIQNDFSCLYGFSQIITNRITPGQLSAKRAFITFGFHNINIFAELLILILPLILEKLIYHKNNKKEKAVLIFSLIVNMGSLYITYTRGAWLAFLLGAFILLISKKYKKLLYVLGALFIVGIKPIGSYILKRGSNMTLSSNESTIARIQSIFTSGKIMSKYPFGTGAGTFADVYKNYVIEGYKLMPYNFRTGITVASYNLLAAHNLFLQIGVELGIVCVIVFVLIIINRAFAATKNFAENRKYLASIAAYTVFSLLTGVEFEHKGIITHTMIIWLVFMLIQINNKRSVKSEILN